MTYDQWKTESGYSEREESGQEQPDIRPWMRHFTSRDQDALLGKVLDYIDKDNVFGDHFSEYERLQIITLLSAPLTLWKERAEHAESVLAEQDHSPVSRPMQREDGK